MAYGDIQLKHSHIIRYHVIPMKWSGLSFGSRDAHDKVLVNSADSVLVSAVAVCGSWLAM